MTRLILISMTISGFAAGMLSVLFMAWSEKRTSMNNWYATLPFSDAQLSRVALRSMVKTPASVSTVSEWDSARHSPSSANHCSEWTGSRGGKAAGASLPSALPAAETLRLPEHGH